MIALIIASIVLSADDARSRDEVEARLDAFNQAWIERDMEFIKSFYAHDEDMLLFFERRQLEGWERVETLYENMFAHSREGSIRSRHTNVVVDAKGELAFVAANFHLQVTSPEGRESADTGRVTVVFERRNGEWVAVHRHTSFQAPPGPQRKVPLHTDPGPLWSPQLEGVWEGQRGERVLATGSYLMSSGVDGFPVAARYRLADEGMWVTPGGALASTERFVELAMTPTELVVGGTRLSRVE